MSNHHALLLDLLNGCIMEPEAAKLQHPEELPHGEVFFPALEEEPA